MIEENIFILSGAVVLMLAGVAAIAATRNLLKVVMGIQAVVLGALLLLAVQGQVGMLLIPAVAAAAAEAVGMAVLVLVWEKYRTADPHQVSELRW